MAMETVPFAGSLMTACLLRVSVEGMPAACPDETGTMNGGYSHVRNRHHGYRGNHRSVLVAAVFLYLSLHKSDLSVIEGNKPDKKKEQRHES
jgi:hypothetical protein